MDILSLNRKTGRVQMAAIKQKELERVLNGLERLKSPSPGLEQYFTPPPVAASIVYDAAMRGDVIGRRIADLGCGVGTFAIASMIMGAASASGFDVDEKSVQTAARNALRCLPAEKLAAASFETLSVEEVKGRFDTVFQNPPFGSQRRNADVPFLKKALEISDTVYTIHLRRTRSFIEEKVRELGGKVDFEKSFTYEMPWMFRFHDRRSRKFELILFKVVKIQI